MQNIKITPIDKKGLYHFGKLSFNTGTFFLASALPIALIFFLFSIFTSIYIQKISFYKNKWNFILLISSVLMIVSSANRYFMISSEIVGFDKSEIWLNLFNWIPLFILFSTIKTYLKSEINRITFSKYLIAGSIPVIISCILQKWFNWYGPHETLNGLIIWFNKELHLGDGVSGLFSNQNYTGFWLSTIFPLSLGILLHKKRSLIKNSFIFIFSTLTFYLTLLTFSRNAIIGLITSLTIILGIKLAFQIIVLIIFLIIFIYFLTIFYPALFLKFLETFLPKAVIAKFIGLDFINFNNWTRLEIWSAAIKLISQKPLLGFGAVSFSLLFITKYNFSHIHNMPLQLAFDYGIPLSLLLCTFVAMLIMQSWNKIMPRNYYIINSKDIFVDKCWLVASIVTVLSHINDISYYDGKISILIWILFAGLVCINEEKKISNQ